MAITEPASYNDMMDYVESRLIPDMNAKKQRGEVFTPLSLINGMLDNLPNKVWSNPNLKWLDPANGIGNFPICVYYRLMEGLKSQIAKAQDRSRHIIENMLYMVELDPTNVAVSKSIFCERDDGVTINGNISQQDFLEQSLPRGWPGQYDVIMGNPPYNKGGVGTGNSIWPDFTKKSITLLKNDGYLLFIHPPGWRKPESERSRYRGLFQLMAHDNYIRYLEIHDATDGQRIFKAGTRFDIYLLQKTHPVGDTTVLDLEGNIHNINLLEWEWLPNFDYELIRLLLATGDEERCPIMYSRGNYGSDKSWVSKTESSEFKYPLINAINQNEIRYMYSSQKDNGFFDESKIIFGKSGLNTPIIDMKGEYGMTESMMAIELNSIEEGKLIRKAYLSNLFKNIVVACQDGNYQNLKDWRLFTYFKKDWYKTILKLEKYL